MLEGARTLLEEQVFAYMYVFLQKKPQIEKMVVDNIYLLLIFFILWTFPVVWNALRSAENQKSTLFFEVSFSFLGSFCGLVIFWLKINDQSKVSEVTCFTFNTFFSKSSGNSECLLNYSAILLKFENIQVVLVCLHVT